MDDPRHREAERLFSQQANRQRPTLWCPVFLPPQTERLEQLAGKLFGKNFKTSMAGPADTDAGYGCSAEGTARQRFTHWRIVYVGSLSECFYQNTGCQHQHGYFLLEINQGGIYEKETFVPFNTEKLEALYESMFH